MSSENFVVTFIKRPVSVGLDVFVATAIAICVYLLFALLFGVTITVGGALAAALAGIVGAMFYMRARTNLTDPTPAFSSKPK